VKGVQDAFARLSGAKRTTVRLQEGLVVVETDPAAAVLPSAFWKEIRRVGFEPVRMELWATGTFGGAGRARYRVANGEEDPPKVELKED
jgi:hypothetical protein